MIIKNLKLIGFGKFKNRDIEFKNGINIIYAENEGGKTTIHNFIDGMFYGFLKPYIKQKKYLEQHNKYRPWDGGRYAGILSLEKDENTYRIEREFTKDKELTKVIIENTGEDISSIINTGDNARVLQPGYHFFGFNSVVYENTVSIKQMSSKTDDRLANEVRDKLINISSSFDDKISVENAIKDLNKSLEKIGSMRAPTSSYRILYDSIDLLKKEKEEILRSKNEYDNLLDNYNDLKFEVEQLADKLEQEKQKYKIVLLQEKKAIYKEALNLKNKILEIEENLKKYEPYKSLSNYDYSKANDILNNINIISSKIDEANIQVNELRKSIKKITEDNINISNGYIEDLSRDYINFESFEEDKNKLLYGNESSAIEFARRDFEKTQRFKSKYSLGLVGMVTIYIMAMLYFITDGDMNNVLLSQAAIIPIILMFLYIRKINTQLQYTERKLDELYAVERDKKANIEDIELKQKNILGKYSVNTKLEFYSLYENKKHESFIIKDKINLLNENKNKINIIINRINELTIDKQNLEQELEQILKRNCSGDLKEFESGLRNKNIYDETAIEYNNKRELLNKVLGSYSIEQLKIELDKCEESFQNCEVLLDKKEDIQLRVNKYTEELNNNKLELKGYDEKLSYLNPRISKLVDIDEAIVRKTNEFNVLGKKKQAVELAIQTIERLSKEIHNQFAPEINIKVGNLIKRITNNRYYGVRIDNKLGIGIINPDSGEIIDISSLSGGTIDQLYFSLRFGIINSITEESLPLILDDCFIQYDDIRMEKLLEFLYDKSKERQIILFSCHNREKDILQRMGKKYNLITLT
jgi:DNA repair exonuclease SbcCD ATPase subunit